MLDTFSSSSTSAALSTGGSPRTPASTLRALSWSTMVSASRRDSGMARKATSSRISTKMPPRPNISTGPKIGSRTTPTMTSTPFLAIGVSSTPRRSAPGS